MSRLGPEPRINAKFLKMHQGQTVRLTAKVIKLSGETATVQASDGGEIGVHLSRDMHIEDSYVEIIGNVRDDNTIKALTNVNLGSDIDLKAVEEVVKWAHDERGKGVL